VRDTEILFTGRTVDATEAEKIGFISRLVDEDELMEIAMETARLDVSEVCVIGVRDEKWGEAIKAVCVLKEGKTVDAETLIEFVASRIARYKKPKTVVYVDSLPKTKTGEVDRIQVKKDHGGEILRRPELVCGGLIRSLEVWAAACGKNGVDWERGGKSNPQRR
jgi:hypothetical protein